MEADKAGLNIEAAPSGRNGKLTLTARLNGEPIHVDELNLRKDKERAGFVAKVCEGRPGIDAAALEAKLLRLAAEVARKPEGAPVDPEALPELDTSRIIRPERFIVQEVSGLAVPAIVPLGNTVAGRWWLYLRWANGRRERRALASTIDVPEGGRLWVHPEPCEPAGDMRPGWSQGARRRWLEGEPAPNPADVFQRICERVALFLHLPKADAPGVTATLACWTIHTYCYQAWPAVPYLYIGGPSDSGKTRVFEVLSRLAFRSYVTSNPSPAFVFRKLHAEGATWFQDEAERLRDPRDPAAGEINAILLAGYKRGGTASRLEPVGDTFKPVSFQVFGPKALACIAGVLPALASRCITVMMFRAPPGSEKPKRRIDADPAGWQGLRDDLHALAMEHGPDFLGMSDRADVCPTGIDGRHYELWQPLLALAGWIEAHGARGLLGLLQEHALRTIDAGKDAETPDADEILLRLLWEAVRLGEKPTPGEILEAAQKAEPETFKRWSPRGVAEHLKRYGLRTHKTEGRKRYSQVAREDFAGIEAAYGIDFGLHESG